MTVMDMVCYYDQLKNGRRLEHADAAHIMNTGTTAQLASLAVLLAEHVRNAAEDALLREILLSNPPLGTLLSAECAHLPAPSAGDVPQWFTDLFAATRNRRPVGSAPLGRLIEDFMAERLPADWMAAWLMTVCQSGLGHEDVAALTGHMRDSGTVYDYRRHPELKGRRRLIRRYPTGALSEKAALILPSLIAAASLEVNVASPFLVARSLGFTGGTWDKLAAIPGFCFPLPGEETVQTLLRCGVAMTVTHGDLNPADRLLYQLRSATGTVESEALIVASIASKQLAVPVDRLLMDIRFGEGAFLNDRDQGRSLAEHLSRVLNRNGVPTRCSLTDTEQPGGASVGNALEVAEAVGILGGHMMHRLDKRWFYGQKQRVQDFFSLLMSAEFPERPARFWFELAGIWLQDGTAARAFRRLLAAHQVPRKVINHLFEDPVGALGIAPTAQTVRSNRNGILKHIDQKSLGYFVNVALGGRRKSLLRRFRSHRRRTACSARR